MNTHAVQRDYSKYLVAVVALIVCLTVLAVPNVVAQNMGNSKVVDPTSVAYGRTYGDWSAAWWQWAFSIPVASHPLFDNGDCSVGQSGPVWFLGGKFCQTGQTCNGTATRSCSVPAGKALYFPLDNVEDSAPEEPNWGCGNSMPPLVAGTIAEMRACAAFYVDPVTGLDAVLDGKHIRNVTHYRFTSVQFDYTLPDDNVLNAIGEGPFLAGTYSPAVDDGYYLMLEPLPAGNHTLHFQATFPNGTSQNITYNLTVGK